MNKTMRERLNDVATKCATHDYVNSNGLVLTSIVDENIKNVYIHAALCTVMTISELHPELKDELFKLFEINIPEINEQTVC